MVLFECDDGTTLMLPIQSKWAELIRGKYQSKWSKNVWNWWQIVVWIMLMQQMKSPGRQQKYYEKVADECHFFSPHIPHMNALKVVKSFCLDTNWLFDSYQKRENHPISQLDESNWQLSEYSIDTNVYCVNVSYTSHEPSIFTYELVLGTSAHTSIHSLYILLGSKHKWVWKIEANWINHMNDRKWIGNLATSNGCQFISVR